MRTVPRILAILPLLASACTRTSTSDGALVLRLNEAMARNLSFTEIEPHGLALDWVEIYNPHAVEIRLDGYSLSDNPERPRKYTFPPHLTIPPRGFLVVFLVGAEDREELARARLEGLGIDFEMTPLHADFAVSPEEDVLFLYAADRRMDRIGFRALPADASFGRYPDGGEAVDVLFAPTPGAPNHPHRALAPRFALGGEPQAGLCVPAEDPVPFRFTLLTDAGTELPDVRLHYVLRPACSLDDEDAGTCGEVFAGVGDGVVEVDVGPPVSELVCRASEGGEPGGEEPGDGMEKECPPETVDGTFGSRAVMVLQYETSLPAEAIVGEGATILWRLEVADAFGGQEVCRCYTYGTGCFTLVVNEYQAVNRSTALFVCENCPNDTQPRTRDWLEIVNYGEEPIDLSEFGLVGARSIRERFLRDWLFGRDTNFDSEYQTIEPGECLLVLADNDGGDLRKVFRRLVPDPENPGQMVPDMSRKFYSTRFALDPRRGPNFDAFALTAPAGNVQVVIDHVLLNLTELAGPDPAADLNDLVADLSFGRFPGPACGAAAGDELAACYPRDALAPGEATDCPTPFECENRASGECQRGPSFLPEVLVSVEGAAGGMARCPALDQAATVTVWLAVDRITAANFDSGTGPSFEVRLDYASAAGAATLLRGEGLVVMRDESREAPRGTALYRIEARIPPQPEGLVTFAFHAVDRRLEAENAPGIVAEVVFDEGTAPSLSFRYFSGPPPVSKEVLLHEVVPDNESLDLPGFPPGFVGDRSPEYIELHLPETAVSDAVDLRGFYLTTEPDPSAVIRQARRAALPPETPLLERGGFLVLALGRVPALDLPFAVISLPDFALDPCTEALYLIGPDAAGNCPVARLPWNCDPAGDGSGASRDIAYGPRCEDPDETVRVTPSPGSPNSLEPVLVSAFHEDPTGVANPCVEPGAFTLITLRAILFVDAQLVATRGPEGALVRREFPRTGGTALGGPSVVRLSRDFARPAGYDALQLSQTIQLTPGTGTLSYRVDAEDTCGGAVDSCPGEEFCFTVGTDPGAAPEVFINEVNRSSSLPGGDGARRPWIELYNASAEDLDLAGMSITADPRVPRRLVFDGRTIVPGGGVLLLVTDGGPPLAGPDAPPHRVVDLDWVPRRDVFNSDGEFVRTNCGRDPSNPSRSAPPVRLFLFDRIDRGSCQADSFVAEFPNPDCGDSTSLGRQPDGGPITVLETPTPGEVLGARFVRGDANEDGEVNLADAVAILEFLFHQGSGPSCIDILDVDDSGALNVSDAVDLLAFLFRRGMPPRPPFPEPGTDPSPDQLPCP